MVQLILVLNTDGIVLECNRASLEYAEVERDAIIGKPCWETFWWTTTAATQRDLRASVERAALGDSVHYETTVYPQTSSFKTATIEVTLLPVSDDTGEVVFITATGRDIAARKTSEREIPHLRDTEQVVARLTAQSEQQRRLYHAILSSTPDLVYVFDLNHRFTYANEALLTMWGKTVEEATGKTCLELGYEPWHAAMHDREIEQVIATRKPVRGDVPFSGTYGRRIYDYIFVPVLRENGEVEAIAGTTRDVTERTLAEDELRRANQDLEQFAYAASHDLQEPLRSIKIYSQLLARRYGGNLDVQGREFLHYLASGASRMEMLVRDLLAYTQIIQSDMAVDSVQAEAALGVALANLSGAINESGAQVTSDRLPVVRVHATHLQQLFQNLVGNAVKYRRPGMAPVIHISAKREDPRWIFTVADNGIGVESEYKELIFGLFKRLHAGDEYSGTRIGLAICQRIVERNHGRIWVESEPGKGSRFCFSLPV
jgi:PAS domain S-box-containing protein